MLDVYVPMTLMCGLAERLCRLDGRYMGMLARGSKTMEVVGHKAWAFNFK